VFVGRLRDADEVEWADVLRRATIALGLRRHFRDPHAIGPDLRQLTALRLCGWQRPTFTS
jgi:hypothetical protein